MFKPLSISLCIFWAIGSSQSAIGQTDIRPDVVFGHKHHHRQYFFIARLSASDRYRVISLHCSARESQYFRDFTLRRNPLVDDRSSSVVDSN